MHGRSAGSAVNTVRIKAPSGRPPRRRADGPPVPLECTEEGCGWRSEGLYKAARYHASSAHHTFRMRIVTDATTEEARDRRRARERAKKAAYRAKKKTEAATAQQQGGAPGQVEGDAPLRPPRFMHFATEFDEEPSTGRVYGMLCVVRPTALPPLTASSGDDDDEELETSSGMMVLASMGALGQGAMRVAASWMVGLVQAGALDGVAVGLRRLGPRQRLLWKAGERLLMQFSGCNGILDGQSPGVAAVLSLLSLVVENKRAGDEGGVVVVTGVVDLVGKVHGVGGLAGKLQGCRQSGARAVMVPAASWEAFDLDDELPGDDNEELRDWARAKVKPYHTLLDAVHAMLDPAFPPLPWLCGRELEEPVGGYWVGVCHTLSYAGEDDEPPRPEPLVVQVGSAHRRGRGRGQGRGEVVMSGVGGTTMRAVAQRAREWVLWNQDVILEACGMEAEEGSRWPWEAEDLLVHMACGGWPDMGMTTYTAVIGLAIVSYFTGRRLRRDTAVLGSLFSGGDRWARDGLAVCEENHVQALKLQGFTRLVVPEGDLAVEGEYSARLEEEGIIVIDAKGEEGGAQEPQGAADRVEYRFGPIVEAMLAK